MRRVCTSLIFGISIALQAICAEPLAEHFKDLKRLERRDFIDSARQLYILGDPKSGSGLFLTQNLRTERLSEAIENSTNAEISLKYAQQVFDLSQAARDLNRQFEDLSTSDRGDDFLESLYQQVKKIAANDPNANFQNLLRRLDLEVDRKIFALAHPLLWVFDPLPGVSGYNVDLFIASQGGISDEVVKKLKANQPLLEGEYFTVRKELSAKTEEVRSKAYRLYLLLLELDKSDFAAEEIQAKAEATGLSSEEAKSIALIYSATKRPRFTIDWNFPVPEDNELIGLDFLIQELGPLSARLRNLQTEKQKDLEWLRRFQKEVYEAFIEKLDGMTLEIMDRAVRQLQSGEWASLGEKFAYFELERTSRLLFLAENFPELRLSQAEALLELRYLDLRPEERLEVLNIFCPKTEDALSFMIEEKSLNETNVSAIRKFHIDLIKAYWNREKPVAPPPDYYFLQGKKYPRIGPYQQKMREMIYENRDKIESGIYPKSFIEYLMIHFYSTPESLKEGSIPLWNDENKAHFWNEWDRQEVVSKNLKDLGELQRRNASAEEVAAKQNEFNEELLKYPTDPDSDFAILGALAYGFVPKDRNDAVSIAKSVGTGVAFLVAGKFFGWKNLSWFIMADTGIRYISAGYFSDDEFDLRRGFSTPLGLWTAQSIAGTWDLYVRVTAPRSVEDELEAYKEIGSIIRDIIIFKEAVAITNKIVDWGRFSRIRKIRSLQEKIQNIEQEIIKNEQELDRIRPQIKTLGEQLEGLQKAKLTNSAEFQKLSAQKLNLQSRASVLEGTAQGKFSRSKLGFYSTRILEQIFRLGDWLLPYSKKESVSVPQESFVSRFNRRRWIGIEQYQAEIVKAEAKIAELQGKQFVIDHRPIAGATRTTYDTSFKGFTKAQERIAKQISEAEALKGTKNYDGALSVIKKAATEIAEGERFLGSLKESAASPKTMSPQSEFMLQIDKFEVEKIRPLVFRQRPLAQPNLRPDVTGPRFLNQADFHLRSQGSFLKEFFGSLKDEIMKLPIESRAPLAQDIRVLDSVLSKY